MLYRVIEDFRDGDPVPVYRRFRDSGRQQPEGRVYHASWVTRKLGRCYQLMECEDPALLRQWMAHWTDVMSFEVVPVVTSAEAVEVVGPRL